MTVALRLADLVSPLRSGAPLGDGDRPALVVAGTKAVRSGEPVVFLKVAAVVSAVVTRKGQVRAVGSPCGHAMLGPLEERLDSRAGAGVTDGIADRAVLDGRYVKGEVKSDFTLKRTSLILPDGSYRAEISGDALTLTVRVIEYFADIGGQEVPELRRRLFEVAATGCL